MNEEALVAGKRTSLSYLDKLPDVLPGVGVGDLVDLVGVQPDLVLAALHHARGQALLELERTHLEAERGLTEETETGNKERTSSHQNSTHTNGVN